MSHNMFDGLEKNEKMMLSMIMFTVPLTDWKAVELAIRIFSNLYWGEG